MTPDPIAQKERDFEARQRKIASTMAAPVRICAASMPHWGQHNHYRPGGGEVLQLQRPGSERAHGLPSRGLGT